VAIWWDLRARRVPNIINTLIALSGFTAQICLSQAPGLSWGLMGCLAAAATLIIPFHLRIYRGGDVKLMIAVGAWLGPFAVAWAVLMGVVLGGLVAAGMLALRPKLRAMMRDDQAQRENRPMSAHVPMALAFGAATFAELWLPAPWHP
jgi:prepilin peptidase CpaA